MAVAVLTAADHAHFHEHGYVIVPEAVPQANLDAALDAIWAFLGMDRESPEDWYRPPATPWGGVEIYQHQALWDNRQHPRVYEAFAELLGRRELWVSIDRAAMKPPMHPEHPEFTSEDFIHWDVDVRKAVAKDLPLMQHSVQGVLALTDTTEEMGGFRCVPGFHRRLKEWLDEHARRDPRWKPDAKGLPARPIPMQAGDLLIWTALLPHGNGANRGGRPRMAQYITMHPPQDEATRLDRVHRWRHRLANTGPAFPGDPRRWEELHGQTADLTPLGRCLLGAEPW